MATKNLSPFWKLNYRHKRFVEALIQHSYNTEAARIQVGLSKQRAYELKNDPRIIAALEEKLKEVRSTLKMGLDETLEGITEIARNKDHKDRLQALRTLAQIHGALGNQTVDINVSVPELKKQIVEVAKKLSESHVVDAQILRALPKRALTQEASAPHQDQH